MGSSQDPTVGQVILLNGTSSAGKSTIAQAIQHVAKQPYLTISLDQFRDGMPDRYRGLNAPENSTGAKGLNVRAERQSNHVLTHIEFGEYGIHVLKAMHRTVATCANIGLNVIVDDMITQRELVIDYVNILRGLPVLCVGIHCEEDELVVREDDRPGRFAGTAISHLIVVHEHLTYDLEIDNTHGDPRHYAELILSKTPSNPHDSAIEAMWHAPEFCRHRRSQAGE